MKALPGDGDSKHIQVIRTLLWSAMATVLFATFLPATTQAALNCSNPQNADTVACGTNDSHVSPQILQNYQGETVSYEQKVRRDPIMPAGIKTKFNTTSQQEKSGQAEASCRGVTANQGARVQVVYLRKPSQPALNAERTSYLQEVAASSSTIIDYSAAKTGGSIKVRWVRNPNCTISVKEIVTAQNAKLTTFEGAKKAMETAGRKSGDRKYMVFLAGNNVNWNVSQGSGTCGTGTLYHGVMYSDGPAQNNINNTRTGYGFVWYGNQRSCWNAPVAAHELSHNLGAVQATAPQTTKAGHCTDGYDLMCYNDTGAKGDSYTTTRCSSMSDMYILDCGNDDYFHSDPVGHNNYLSTRWNIANSRFLNKRVLTQ